MNNPDPVQYLAKKDKPYHWQEVNKGGIKAWVWGPFRIQAYYGSITTYNIFFMGDHMGWKTSLENAKQRCVSLAKACAAALEEMNDA